VSRPAEERKEREEFLKALGTETTLESDLIARLHWADEKYTRVRDPLLRLGRIERIGPYKIRATVIPIKRAFKVAPLEMCTKDAIWETASELYHQYKDITVKKVRKGKVYETPKWTVLNWRTYLYWCCRKYGRYLFFTDEECRNLNTLKDYSSPAAFIESKDGMTFLPPLADDYTAYEEALKEEESIVRADELHRLADELRKFRRRELKEEDIYLLSDKHIRAYERSIKQARKQRDAAKGEIKSKDKEIERLQWELEDLKEDEKKKPPAPRPVRWTKELEGRLRDRYYATLSKLGIRITTGLKARFRDEIPDLRRIKTEKEMLEASEKLAHVIARRPPKPPKPKELPPVPEVCPIDGTKLDVTTRAPIFISDPLRLSSEEEYWRASEGIPLPVEHMEWIPVPLTMKVWMCRAEVPHYFERDAAGRLVQRTPEFIYRKILRETAKLRKLAPPPVVGPPAVGLPPARAPIIINFERWLKQIKRMYFGEYGRLSALERTKILKEYQDYHKAARR